MKFYRIFFRFILTRRYRIEVRGADLLMKEGGKLVMPNHQSHIDPQLIAIEFYKYSDIVPVVNESLFKIPVVKFFFRKWGAIPVAEFKKGNRDPNVLKHIFSNVIAALTEGKSVIIYPSGQLQDLGIEQIKNKQSAHTIVSNLPQGVRVLGVRVKGLWGSTFSKAWTGVQPPFLPTFLKGIFYFFANFIFFCPKRDVIFEIVDITEDALKQAKNDRRTFNHFLEDFYNEGGIEKPVYIRHFFYFPKSKKKLPQNIVTKYEKNL